MANFGFIDVDFLSTLRGPVRTSELSTPQPPKRFDAFSNSNKKLTCGVLRAQRLMMFTFALRR
jgi:hypothetical protein